MADSRPVLSPDPIGGLKLAPRTPAHRPPSPDEASGWVAVVRTLSVVAALVIAAGALAWPALRDAEGFLRAEAALPLSVAVAVALVGLAFGSAFARASRWSALALVGQAMALQLVHAGHTVAYQHYRPWGDLAGRDAALSSALLLALLAVVAGLWREWGTVRGWLRGRMGAGALVLLAVLFAGTSATLSRDPVVYAEELVVATLVQGLLLGAVVLAACATPAPAALRLATLGTRLFGAPGVEGRAEPGGVDRYALVLAAFAAATAAVLSLFVYQLHPHVPDEVVYLIHARYFARGMLSMPLPPAPHATSVDLMTYEATRWFSPVPPGWPAVLALGVLAGIPWMVNPLLTGINVLLAYVVLRELYDRRTARIATLFLALSPWQLFLGMSLMTHAFTLTSALVAALGVARLRRGGSLWWGVLGGVAVGLVGLSRPLEGVAVALLLGVWVLAMRARSPLLPAASLTVGGSVVVALTLGYNRLMTGSATTFPIMAYIDKYYAPGANDLGFGPNRGLGWTGVDPLPGHGPLDVLINANMNAFAVNVELFGWGAGSVLFVFLVLALRRARRPDWLMLAVIAMIVGIHSLYWFSGGPDFGARYWYLILVPCAALAARGVVELEGAARSARAGRVLLLFAVLCAGTLVDFLPWRSLDKYHHYRGMRPDVRVLARDPAMAGSVVFIRGKRHPDYASAVVYNPLDLRDPDAPVFLWDRDAQARGEALRAYPDRTYWIVDGPTRTGRGYRVERGPISAAEFAREVGAR
jgi:4-amino-4-deoxy-L-arabinose transferase-like glycosyltransferase